MLIASRKSHKKCSQLINIIALLFITLQVQTAKYTYPSRLLDCSLQNHLSVTSEQNKVKTLQFSSCFDLRIKGKILYLVFFFNLKLMKV